MTKEEQLIQVIQQDKKRLTEAMAILDKVVEKLKNGATVIEIEETMSEEMDRAEELIGQVYFGE